jgi:hypothetical protein
MPFLSASDFGRRPAHAFSANDSGANVSAGLSSQPFADGTVGSRFVFLRAIFLRFHLLTRARFH